MNSPLSAIRTFNVQGIAVSAINMKSANEAILTALSNHEKGYICVTGVHGISESQNEPQLRKIHNEAFLVTPDGMSLVWVGKWMAGKCVDRVYGPDLMMSVCEATENSSYKHFIYGGAPGVAERLCSRLREKFQNLNIVGMYTPPFRRLNKKEETAFIQTIDKVAPTIIWVGLSNPKQEYFMAEYLSKLNTTLMIGVAAAFDFHSGSKRQAPYWIQRSGFEWLYRLIHNPAHLWKRYLKNNPLFILRFLAQITGLKKYT